MAQIVRKAQPDCLRYFLKILRFTNNEESNNGGREESCTVDSLVDVLLKKGGYTIETAKETVVNALRDGLLMPAGTYGSSPRLPRAVMPELKRVRLPNIQEVNALSSHDFYCYECYLPGMLEQCRQCWRSFHRLCYRKNPERPNYAIPSSKIQKNRLPAFSSENESDSDENDTVRSTVLDYESDMRANSSLTQLDQTSIASCTPQRQSGANVEMLNNDSSSPSFTRAAVFANTEGKPLLDDLESKAKVEVVCMGEIRPPNRQRPNTTASTVSYKSEISPTEDEHDLELCTCCRLLKRADLRNPANLQADELCHLVSYTFFYNREWLQHDVRSYLDSRRFNNEEVNTISRLLLHSPLKRLDDVAENLKKMEYSLLMEFLVDLLDIQYSVGVFFGSCSTELESTKWLLRDITHDLSEIRRCPDCFRYSHEKQSNIWFAKPCVQRHELVYAKHSGFPYWPAKVIRVLSNNKFDVRFFGGNHSRALIDVRFIKTIDADVKSLKMGNSTSIKKAMEELRCHQMLSTYPPSKFSFHADPQETAEIIRTVLGTATMDMPKEKKARRKRKISSMGKDNTNDEQAHLQLSQEDQNEQNAIRNNQTAQCSEVSVSIKRLKTNNSIKTTNEENNNTNKRSTRKSNTSSTGDVLSKMTKELEETKKIINYYKQKNEKLEAQKQKFKDTIKKQELERKIMKRKQWCYWCLEEAIYLCCFRAAYCSEICQARHWKEGHSKVCKNQSVTKKSL